MNKFIALLCAAAITVGSGVAIVMADEDVDTSSDDTADVVDTVESDDTDVSEELSDESESDDADTEETDENTDVDVQEETTSDLTTDADADKTSTEDTEVSETAGLDATAATETSEETKEEAGETVAEEVKTEATDEVAEESGSIEVIDKTGVNPFVDCQDEWFTDYVTFAYENGIVIGVDKNHFDPEGNITMAQLAVMLYRVHSNQLSIVTEGDYWASEAMDWALANDIMYDFAGDKFNASKELTREEIVTALYNSYRINNTPDAAASLEGFPDEGEVSEFAYEAMEWAVASGIIKGVSDVWIAPKNHVTRAQTATIFQRYLQNLTFNDVAFDENAKVVVVENAEDVEKVAAAEEVTEEPVADAAEETVESQTEAVAQEPVTEETAEEAAEKVTEAVTEETVQTPTETPADAE